MDAQIFHWIYGCLHRPPWLLLMSGLTHLGSSKVVLTLAALGFLEGVRVWGRPGSRRGAGRPAPWLGIGIAAAIAGGLKEAVSRPRPAEVYAALGLLAPDVQRSFPSGHATMAFALATACSFRWPKGWFIWFGLAGLVAVSRVVLGVHWPSDVMGGALIGTGTVVLADWVGRRFRVSV